MGAIVLGVAIAAYGLLPKNISGQLAASQDIVVSPPEDAPLTRAHWMLMGVLVIALIIDIMKPASLGFTIPGMVSEYGVPKATASLVPFFALTGTVIGSIVWGVIADVYGRKASILLSAVMFVGTSICGAMPSLYWNIGMCFMMGAAAGGMLPVTYALLAEMMPSKHRGWALVLVGGLGAVGGYFAASGFSALAPADLRLAHTVVAQPADGPVAGPARGVDPESAKFLLARGRREEARRVMERFGSKARKTTACRRCRTRQGADRSPDRTRLFRQAGRAEPRGDLLRLDQFRTAAVAARRTWSRGATAWPLSSKLLAESALIAFPTVFVVAYLYSRWSTKWSVVGVDRGDLRGLAGVLWLEFTGTGSPVLPVALLIVGTNALIAMLLPYAAESFPLRIRGRTTGTVAACTKAGGMFAQVLAILALVPALDVVSLIIIVPTVASLMLVWRFGKETRGRDLRDLDPDAARSRRLECEMGEGALL